jgi:hypothetical protein
MTNVIVAVLLVLKSPVTAAVLQLTVQMIPVIVAVHLFIRMSVIAVVHP